MIGRSRIKPFLFISTVAASLFLYACDEGTKKGTFSGATAPTPTDGNVVPTADPQVVSGWKGGLAGLISEKPALIPPSSTLVESAVKLGPSYASSYKAYLLGKPNGLPGSVTFGAPVINPLDPNKLILTTASAGKSEIYEVSLARDVNGMITGFAGQATKILSPLDSTSSSTAVDGGAFFDLSGRLILTTWPFAKLFEFDYATKSIQSVTSLGLKDQLSCAGCELFYARQGGAVNIVPAEITAAAGKMKYLVYLGTNNNLTGAALTSYNSLRAQYHGAWFDVTFSADANGKRTTTLKDTGLRLNPDATHGADGFMYVAAGSPGFAEDSLLVTDFGKESLVVYKVDANGNPIVSSGRSLFASNIVKPIGAILDKVGGDLIFSTWDATGGTSSLHVIRGFSSTATTPVGIQADVVVDLNKNGAVDADEPRQTTSATGAYSFLELEPAEYQLLILDADGSVRATFMSQLIDETTKLSNVDYIFE